MNLTVLKQEIDKDLQAAADNKVIYLEGVNDVAPFFGLLGVAEPPRNLHRGVLVKGLAAEKKSRGSGGSAVKARIAYALENKYAGVFGFIDGDGRSLALLAQEFDPPHSGPLFSWKAYCIENLLAQTGWPPAWGDDPDWPEVIRAYAPYAAFNRLHWELHEAIEVVGIARRRSPSPDQSLLTAGEIEADLVREKDRLTGFDVEQNFHDALAAFEAAVAAGLPDAHAALNGKWLVEHLAQVRARSSGRTQSKDDLRREWSEHARACGGHPGVRDVWERIVGAPP